MENFIENSKLSGVQFSIRGEEDTLLQSNAEVKNSLIFRGDLPAEEGVYDPHLGTTDNEWNCMTCLNNKKHCPGHTGHASLVYPVKSPLFRSYIVKWLNLVCYNCGSLVIKSKDIKNIPQKDRMKSVKGGEEMPCPHCGIMKSKAIFDKFDNNTIYTTTSDPHNKYRELFNNEIKTIFSRVKDSDVELMGFPVSSKPYNLIIKNMMITPNTIRPKIKRSGNQSSNNDITSITKNIIEINEKLSENKIFFTDTKDENILNDFKLLDLFYYEKIKGSDNISKNVRVLGNKNKQINPISKRLVTKRGRIRGNIMGKRCSYTARSVITGDSKIAIDEIGVPLLMAKTIMIPKRVTPYNFDDLNRYYKNGSKTYPGCEKVFIKEKEKYYLSDILLKNGYKLRFGDVVYRHLINGDPVNFNRQPSLTNTSIGTHYTRVIKKGYSFRINISACSAYNADFDGDAMNLFIPQDPGAVEEIKLLSWIGNWSVSYQNYSPVFGCYQDSIIGSSEISKIKKFTREEAMIICSGIQPFNEIHIKGPISGIELLSFAIPDINFPPKKIKQFLEQYSHIIEYDPENIKLEIVKGQIKRGFLDKNSIGDGIMGSIFHVIIKERGSENALRCIFNLQKMASNYFTLHGFTVGVKDVIISDQTKLLLKEKIKDTLSQAEAITEKYNNLELVPPLGMTTREFYEELHLNSLSPGDSFIEPILHDIDIKNNGILQLVITGSKGKLSNVLNINGSLGSITISGKRPPMTLAGRTNAYFYRNDFSPQARGYIKESYREGVKPINYLFVCQDARYGLISNQLSTSLSGEQTRIGVKNLESAVIDNTLKLVKGDKILQTLYGGLGLDIRKMEKVKFIGFEKSESLFEEMFRTRDEEIPKIYRNEEVRKALEEEYQQLLNDKRKYIDTFIKIEHSQLGVYHFDPSIQCPFNPYRILEEAVIFSNNSVSEEKDPILVLEKIRKCSSMLENVILNFKETPEFIKKNYNLFTMVFRNYFNTKKIFTKGVNMEELDRSLEKVRMSVFYAIAPNGTAAGVIAAQSLSEPLTQYVLDSKHRTGGGGGTKTSVIERIKEIYTVKEGDSIKNPEMTIYLNEPYNKDKERATLIANKVEMMPFQKFVSEYHLFWEEPLQPIHPDFLKDKKKIDEYIDFMRLKSNHLTKWCLRISIDREEMIKNTMDMKDIVISLNNKIKDITTIHSPEGYKDPFIRIYFNEKGREREFNSPPYKKINDLLETNIRGISNIIYAEIKQINSSKLQEDGSVQKEAEYIIKTSGSNLEEILLYEEVDPYRTQTNDIVEYSRMHGIEAGRNKIIYEIRKTMTGGNIIEPHCSVYADDMTTLGFISPIELVGIKKREENNILLQLSFKSPLQTLTNAALYNTESPIKGISANQMMGTVSNIGSYYNDLCLNDELLKKMSKTYENEYNYI